MEPPRRGEGRAGVGGDRPHGAGLCRLDAGGAARSTLGRVLPVATDLARPVVARVNFPRRTPPPWLPRGAVALGDAL